jgi:glycosyltransferase involved in cell wall biosynthesis
MVERVRRDGFRVEVVPLRSAFKLRDAVRLARRLRAERIDVLDTHTLFAGNQLARVAGMLAHVPVINHAHVAEQYHGAPAKAALQRALDHLTIRLCAATISVSHELAGVIAAQGLAGRALEVIHNGVAVEPWQAAEPRPELHVACVARLAEVKGQHVLLEALAAAGPGIRATMVGAEL